MSSVYVLLCEYDFHLVSFSVSFCFAGKRSDELKQPVNSINKNNDEQITDMLATVENINDVCVVFAMSHCLV